MTTQLRINRSRAGSAETPRFIPPVPGHERVRSTESVPGRAASFRDKTLKPARVPPCVNRLTKSGGAERRTGTTGHLDRAQRRESNRCPLQKQLHVFSSSADLYFFVFLLFFPFFIQTAWRGAFTVRSGGGGWCSVQRERAQYDRAQW